MRFQKAVLEGLIEGARMDAKEEAARIDRELLWQHDIYGVCHRHPHVKIRSDNGLFDAPCGECEAAMEGDA